MICVDFFDKGELKSVTCYKDIITDILDGMNYNFNIPKFEEFSNFGYIFPEIFKDPDLYLVKNDNDKLLRQLKEKGKYLFFCTNSNHSYSNFILEKAFGKDYYQYFDLCFYKCSKPKFFQESYIEESKCFFLDQTGFNCSEFNNDIMKKY